MACTHERATETTCPKSPATRTYCRHHGINEIDPELPFISLGFLEAPPEFYRSIGLGPCERLTIPHPAANRRTRVK
jgi:hypothetical protein